MNDFEARRKMNDMKTKVGQEARANPPAAAPVRVPVYPHPVFAVVCGFFNGIGLAVCQVVGIYLLFSWLTKEFYDLVLDGWPPRPTPFGWIVLIVITSVSCLWSGYVTARLSAAWRFVLALGVGCAYAAILLAVGGPSWQWTIPPLVCLGGSFLYRP